MLAEVISPLTQILAVISGFGLMGGSLYAWRQCKAHGFICFVIAVMGGMTVMYGIGGSALVNAILNG